MKNNKKLFKHPFVSISTCDLGRGVFATKSIPADTTIEECPFLRINALECAGALDDYVFNMDADDEQTASNCYILVLGWGSLFNHSDTHNTEYWHDTDRDVIVFHTIKRVSAGEQLFVNYGEEWWDTRPQTPKK